MESVKEINENAHSKIMKEMSKYLDACKSTKTNCNCTCVLEYDPNEPKEFKKFKFTYQCGTGEDSNQVVKKLTIDLLQNIKPIDISIYKVKLII